MKFVLCKIICAKFQVWCKPYRLWLKIDLLRECKKTIIDKIFLKKNFRMNKSSKQNEMHSTIFLAVVQKKQEEQSQI